MIVLHPEQVAAFEGNTHARIKMVEPGIWAIRPTTRVNTPQGEYRVEYKDGMLTGRHPIPDGLIKLKEIKGWFTMNDDGLPAMVGGGEDRKAEEAKVDATAPAPLKKRGRVASDPTKYAPKNWSNIVVASRVEESAAMKIIREYDPAKVITMDMVDPNWVDPTGMAMPPFLKRLTAEQAEQYKVEHNLPQAA